MKTSATNCPSNQLLVDFALGKVDEGSIESIGAHLANCATCRRYVETGPEDGFLNRLQDACRERDLPTLSHAMNASETPSPVAQPRTRFPASESALPAELSAHPDYDLIKELGRGGMGIVYLARNRVMDRLEVLKVVGKSILEVPGAVERFKQEIRSAARLNHPNIVAAYRVLQSNESLIFAMEYVDGRDLSQVVKAHGPLPIAHAAFYGNQVALGLQHAHEQGMVHRDIKPSNLMLSQVNNKHIVKILDFGLAKATSEKLDDRGLTRTGQLLGTPDYIAPEQTIDAPRADIRADIYSLGCTLYYCLARRPPFRGKSLFDILRSHHEVEARPLNELRSDVPIELARVVARMMAKRPDDRYQTPAEAAQALAPFVTSATRRTEPNEAVSESATVRRPEESGKVGSVVGEPASTPSSQSADATQAWGGPAPIVAPVARPSAARRPLRRKKIVFGLIASGLLGMIPAAAIVFRIVTPDGVVVVTVNVPNPDVTVDGEKVTVEWSDTGKRAELRLRPGTHTIELKKDGFKAFGRTVSIADENKEVLSATLEPLAVAVRPAIAATSAPLARASQTSIPPTTPISVRPSNTGLVNTTQAPRTSIAGPQPASSPSPVVAGSSKFNVAGLSRDERLNVYRDHLKVAWPSAEVVLAYISDNKLELRMRFCPAKDLSPLVGIPLQSVQIGLCSNLKDVSALKTMPLTFINLHDNPEIEDVTFLTGMPIEGFSVTGSPLVKDYSCLEGMPLRFANLEGDMSKLKFIRNRAIRQLSLRKAWNFEALSGMTVESLSFMECDVARLDLVTQMNVKNLTIWDCPNISDISMLRDVPLKGISIMNCSALTDLTPLKGMKLESVDFRGHTNLSDLKVFEGMPITSMSLGRSGFERRLNLGASNQVRDLSPLRGMPMTYLLLGHCILVKDFTPLVDLPLESLGLPATVGNEELATLKGLSRLKRIFIHDCAGVTDLSAFSRMPLEALEADGCSKLADLTPLADKKLRSLWIERTAVTDLTPLRGMPLVSLSFTPQNITRGIEVLREIPELRQIRVDGSQTWLPVADFWRRYDAGEFRPR